MPFAANGRISTDAFPDAIEITEGQYAEALEGMCAGLVVNVDKGFSIAPPVAPEAPPAAQPTHEELSQIAFAERDMRLAEAAFRIAPLQSAVDINVATAAELALIVQWKTYQVTLNRIQDQSGFPISIAWPELPA